MLKVLKIWFHPAKIASSEKIRKAFFLKAQKIRKSTFRISQKG
jgi:hypothetical protein